MRRAGISAQVRARGTLRENLVKSKDKIKQNNKTGVVYYAPCAGSNDQPCESKASYVGETSRQGSQRFKEHMSTAKMYNGDYKSAIMQHAVDTGHSFRETDVEILDTDANWRSRGIRESAYIRALDPSLNRRSDRNDRYTLPSTYDSILRSAVKNPSLPTPHGQNESRRPGRQRTITPTAQPATAAMTTTTTDSQPRPHHMTTRRRALASVGAAGTP